MMDRFDSIGRAAVALRLLCLGVICLSASACITGTLAPGSGGAPSEDLAGGGIPAAGSGELGPGGTDLASSSSGGDPAGAPTDLGTAFDASGPAGPGVFVAVGYGGRRARSLDRGLTWVDDQQLVANGGDDTNLLRTVVWGAGQFVALGWRVMTSPDGKLWTDAGTAPLDQWVGAATYVAGKYVAVGGYGSRIVSSNAVSWTDHAVDTDASHSHDGLAFGDVLGGRFVSVSDSGKRRYSTAGTAWVDGQGATGTASTHVAFGNGRFVAIGGKAVVVSTDGGATWATSTTLAADVAGVVFAQGHFTAIASGHAFTSTDGLAWTDHVVNGLSGGYVVYGDSTYILVNYGSVRRSSDGIAWGAPINLGSGNAFEFIAFGML